MACAGEKGGTKGGEKKRVQTCYRDVAPETRPKTIGNAGEPCWTRTSDPLLKRQMLYRLS